MSAINYVTMDRIFSKIHRDLRGTDTNETDIIEWTGEALEFLKVPQVLEQDVVVLNVKDYHVCMPDNLHLVTQIARNNNPEKSCACSTTDTSVEEEDTVITSPTPCGCDYTCPDRILNPDWTYEVWTSSPEYIKNYTPVRLSTGTFFNSLVCQEKDTSLYLTCSDEYTIVGTTEKKLRFNFIEGQVAISFLKNTVDPETGYPLIPDNISYITAILYYVKWKVAELNEWAGREGWSGKAEKAEARWSKYVRQAKNFMKMPKTLDEHQNLLEQSHYLIPNHKRYYSYFGNLGKSQSRNFNNLNRTYN
tara:strand:+ start:1212 stop:2126 length:915 start_codon:yes stop_codon:yes gene_type:complete